MKGDRASNFVWQGTIVVIDMSMASERKKDRVDMYSYKRYSHRQENFFVHMWQ
jgi:hypothetical protein